MGDINDFMKSKSASPDVSDYTASKQGAIQGRSGSPLVVQSTGPQMALSG